MASSDIVERLKSAAKPLQHMGNEEEALAAAAIEAANEIEKLRAEIVILRAENAILCSPLSPMTLRDAIRCATDTLKGTKHEHVQD